MKLQLETPKVVGISVVIHTKGACSEMKPLEPTVIVAAKFNKVIV